MAAASEQRRTAIVTGSNTGVGRETALALASSFHVILACRSEVRGKEAADWILDKSPCASVQVMPLDLSDFGSVVAFAKRIRAEVTGGVSVLVLNAGVGGMAIVQQAAAEGDDFIFKVNFVSHFLLTLLLQEDLAKAAPSRVVCLSSVMHRFGKTDFADALKYSSSRRSNTYATSKLAMAVLAAEICRRWSSTHGISGIAVNPGAVNSDIWYRGQLPTWLQDYLVRPTFTALFLDSRQGSATSVAAATDPQHEGATPGLYLSPYRSPPFMPLPFDLYGPFAGARKCRPHPAVTDEGEGAKLWRVTTERLQASGFLAAEGA